MLRTEYITRLYMVCFAGFCLVVALLGHVFNVQVGRHPELFPKAQKKYTKERVKEGRRGLILDRNGNKLASSINAVDVYAEKRHMKKHFEAIKEVIYKHFPSEEAKIEKRFASKLKEIVIVKRVKLEKVKAFKKDIIDALKKQYMSKLRVTKKHLTEKQIKIRADREYRIERYPGLRFVDTTYRFYPKGVLASNLIGYMGIGEGKDTEYKGRYGIEKIYESKLKSVKGFERVEESVTGNKVRVIHKEQIKDGNNVYLTIDEPIQAIVEEELRLLVKRVPCKNAYIIMADPKTGGILAMAQYPTFNPNDRDSFKGGAFTNRMLTSVLEPGSTMKPVFIAGALKYKKISMNTMIDCTKTASWTYGGKVLTDTRPKGIISVEKVIEVSSNIGTAKIGVYYVGNQLTYQILRSFGFGKYTNIGLGPESRGILRQPNKWQPVDITRFVIGYGVSVTPLQMLQAYCTLANGGVKRQLHTVSRVEDVNTGEIHDTPLPEPERIIPEKATKAVVKAMVKVTESGTGKKARVPGYKVAGKTGTAKKYIENQGYSDTKYFGSFIGMVPASNPRFVLYVIVDEPPYNNPRRGTHHGGSAAGPTFSNIALKTLHYLDVPPDEEE